MSNFTEAMANDNEPHRCTQEGACYCKDGTSSEDVQRVRDFVFQQDVEKLLSIDPIDRIKAIVVSSKDFSDEQMRELILALQKVLSNR